MQSDTQKESNKSIVNPYFATKRLYQLASGTRATHIALVCLDLAQLVERRTVTVHHHLSLGRAPSMVASTRIDFEADTPSVEI